MFCDFYSLTYEFKQYLAKITWAIWHPVDLNRLNETSSIYFNMYVPHHLSQKRNFQRETNKKKLSSGLYDSIHGFKLWILRLIKWENSFLSAVYRNSFLQDRIGLLPYSTATRACPTEPAQSQNSQKNLLDYITVTDRFALRQTLGN